MADKKLNSVSPVTDAAYVYAETSNGETVKISKADLAAVVAEQMGIKSKGNISNIKATPMTLGTHTFAGSATGGITGYSGQMLVFGADESSNVRLLISQDVLAFTRDGLTWYKVNTTLVQ